jgi:two-component system sensor histidine kinase KdpD
MREFAQGSSYFVVFCLVLLFTAVNKLIDPYVGYRVVGVLFLLGILLLSLFFRKGPVFFGAILYGLIWDYFFIPPVETLELGEKEDIVLLGLFLLTAIVTGILTDRARVRLEMLTKREASTQALYEIVRQIATSPSSKEIIQSIKTRLDGIFHGQVEFFIKRFNNGLEFNEKDDAILTPKEQAAALWVFENNKEAGWSTATLPASIHLFIPLKGYKEMVGVLAYRPDSDQPLTMEEKNFLFTSGQQLAYYLERRFSEEMERQIEQRKQIERIYQQVYRSIPPITGYSEDNADENDSAS